LAEARCKSLEIRLSDLRYRARIARKENSAKQQQSLQTRVEDLARVKELLTQERTLRRQQSGKGRKMLRTLEMQITNLRQDNASLRNQMKRDADDCVTMPILRTPKKQSTKVTRTSSKRPSSMGKKEGILRKRDRLSKTGTLSTSPLTAQNKVRLQDLFLNDEASDKGLADAECKPVAPNVQPVEEIANFDCSPLLMESIDEFEISSPSLQPSSPRIRTGIIVNPMSARSAPAILYTNRKSPVKFSTPSRKFTQRAQSGRLRKVRTKARSSTKRLGTSSSISSRLTYETTHGSGSRRSVSSGVNSSSSPRSRKKRSSDAIRRHIERTRQAKQKALKDKKKEKIDYLPYCHTDY